MKILLNGENGQIEASYHRAKETNKKIAVVFHDHPSANGSMNEKVNYTIFHTFATNGFNVIRANYRGIGNSRGPFTNGEGELCDGANILDWLEKNNEFAEETWVAGIGFGAWICFQLLMRRPDITNFAVVSPNIKKYDYSFVNSTPCKGIIVNNISPGETKDDGTKQFVSNLNKSENSEQITLKMMNGTDSKYENRLKELYGHLSLYVMKHTHKFD